ncbi:MAG: hypothetical protein KAY82_01480 [Hylemonella sp.]|nr:hypothetical protein [Hylemonella sp.]
MALSICFYRLRVSMTQFFRPSCAYFFENLKPKELPHTERQFFGLEWANFGKPLLAEAEKLCSRLSVTR